MQLSLLVPGLIQPAKVDIRTIEVSLAGEWWGYGFWHIPDLPGKFVVFPAGIIIIGAILGARKR